MQALSQSIFWVAAIGWFLLSGCSNGSGKASTVNPAVVAAASNAQGVVYDGPPPSSEDVVNFKVSFWDNIALDTRCGGCHIEGVNSLAFARSDDIHLAYADANSYVNLRDPASSRLVTKVASGHGCWSANTGLCEDKITQWITSWATQSGVKLTQTALKVPEIQEVSASLTYSDSSGAFSAHVYPLLTTYCADCHRADAPEAPMQPYFASSNVNSAYLAAQTKMRFNITGDGNQIDASRSRLVMRLREDAHSCWANDCVAASAEMEQALQRFAASMEVRGLDASLVTSKALRLGDGTAISQGGRIETNAIAVYPFKAGRGTVASDYSDGFGAALDLELSGDVEWLSNWGIRFNNGRAQGSVASSSKLRTYIGQTGEYSVEAWVVPANVTQEGPARIVTYSGSNNERNFTLAQTLYNYNFLNRSATTDANGSPAVSTPDAAEVLQASLQHVVASYHALEGRKLYVNGTEVGMADEAGVGNFNSWDPTFALIAGNEASGQYPWRGTLRFLAIHNRALSLEQAKVNFEVGVGQKILVAFSVAEHIEAMSDAYIVFQVEQFDEYSYLFTKPYFFSFGQRPRTDIAIQGLRIGINGREAPVGQSFANLDRIIERSDFNATGVSLSSLGAVIEAEQGVEQDQFFLSFDRLGQTSHTRATEPRVYASEAEDMPTQAKIGIRHFADINASLSAMTGVSISDPGVRETYRAVEQQMPSSESVEGFLVAHQMGITQLAVKYCSTLAGDSAGFFPNFTGVFDAQGRSAIIDPLLAAMLAHTVASEAKQLSNQPLTADSRGQLNNLIDVLSAGCPAGRCTDAVTRNTITAVCAAAMGSAVMLVQ